MAENEDRQEEPIQIILANDVSVLQIDDVGKLLPFRFVKLDLGE